MTRKDYIQEFLDMFGEGYKVVYGDQANAIWEEKLITFPKSRKDFQNLDSILTGYALIDKGYDWFNYCSYETFVLLHEIGHLEVGNVEALITYFTRVYNCDDSYNGIKQYINIPDEREAWKWGWEFLNRNKDFIKRFDNNMKRDLIFDDISKSQEEVTK